jgi:uncharacterized lipoprotein YmbA
MKRTVFSCLSIVSLWVCLVFLGGCVGGQSAPSRFYLLSPIPDTNKEVQAPAADGRVAIGIGPIDLPDYLDRPQIVTRLSRNRLGLAEFDKWAEPVKDNFTRVLVENLSKLLRTEPVFILPGQGGTPINFRVSVEVLGFDGTPGKSAQLTARWMIFDGEDRKMLVTRESIFSESVNGGSYEALVSTMSGMIEALSREIAEGIKKVL